MTDRAADTISAIESRVATDIGRGSGELAPHTRGSLHQAALTLTTVRPSHVVVLTGFYIPTATPPLPETDGPLGAVQIASAVVALGGTARILTDSLSAPAIETVLRYAGLSLPVDIAPIPGEAGEKAYLEWEEELLATYTSPTSPVTCMVSVERAGPAADGNVYNMRAIDISGYTAPLHRVFEHGPWTTIGIGDGGNEIGMGVLPAELVSQHVRHGSTIHCRVGCESLIVAGTSNWGAAGLVAATQIVSASRNSAVASLLDPNWSIGALTALTSTRTAVDGVLQHPSPTVDGLDQERYTGILAQLAELAQS
ncbi:uncharacterized protein DUF4392 [Saccharothrix carnea]|uniref:Uncharacterized protein DUF4392 n=1 Tax=Saccharothrix carnea TaxID=1280637 RepID=A0A2P8I603_SACCR|nr:glutamate cyclase domain-containing protein [Saccharothrix carnea]PSL53897.1 uncharacterized protein DUF4392 [Saccharothrix carnea]